MSDAAKIVGVDLDAWKNIPGWTCHRLREWYDEVARTIPIDGTFVEIGVAYGCSLAYVIARFQQREDAQIAPSIRSVGVDIWAEHQGKGQLSPEDWDRVTSHGDAFEACVRELGRSAQYVFGRLTLVRETGVDAAALMKDESVDVLFIDEHHTRESVSTCIAAWLPKMKKGGIMSGHDCNPNYPGVLQAVGDLLKGAEVRAPHPDDNGWGGVWIWRKP